MKRGRRGNGKKESRNEGKAKRDQKKRIGKMGKGKKEGKEKGKEGKIGKEEEKSRMR